MTFKKYKEWVLKDPRSEKLDFNIDGRKHYVYRISKDGEHYYGSKSEILGIIEETIGNGYYTSSYNLDFKKDFKNESKDYKIKIIRYFDNPSDKILFESYLHQYFDVKNHDNFINMSNQTPFGFDVTGRKASEETIKNMIEAQAKINADPIKVNERRLKKLKIQKEIEDDPIKVETIKDIGLKAANRGHQKYKNNPKLYKLRSNRQSNAAKKTPVSQYDTDEIFIRSFSTQKEAAEYYNYPNPSGISQCVNGRIPTYKGFIWRKQSLRTTTDKGE